MKSAITTHILDTSLGRPAGGVLVRLDFLKSFENWENLAEAKTDLDGRIFDWLPSSHSLKKGIYRISFQTKEYFAQRKLSCLYPSVNVIFEVSNEQEHYHIPLLLNAFGYSTYRGS